MLRKIETPLYTAKTHTEGGRDGRGRSSDGYLDLVLTPPALGRPGTNPEQLLGIGWSACFMGAMRRAGTELGIAVPKGVEIDAEVTLGNAADMGFALAMKMTIRIPLLAEEDKQRLVAGAHDRCPYSLATKGNIEVAYVIT
ncbi:MAG: Ohr family peroxiredoxin [Paucibacter sp.]|nr:Ohr family peroxiredoxin [Roseateles sp.]